MFKLNKLMVLLFISSTIFMSSCNSEQDKSTQELNEKLEQLRVDYFNQVVIPAQYGTNPTVDDVKINEFYGNYNEAYVASFFINHFGGGGAWGVIKYYMLDGVEIVFRESIPPIVWKNGTIFEFEEAYEKRLLTKDDLLTIVSVIESN